MLNPQTSNVDLSDLQAQYHLMIQEVEDYAILMLDRHGIVLNWNKGASKIKGYEPDEIIGKHFRIFYREQDQASGVPDQLISIAMKEGKAIHEGWRVRKDGSVFWGSTVITALHGPSGKVLGFCKVTRDLTERKAAEDKLLLTSRQLENQNKELQQFAAIAAHDLKLPLRKIQLYISSILDDSSQHVLSSDQRKALEKSIVSSRRMGNLIDDLLSYASVSGSDNHLELADLNDIVANVHELFEETLAETASRLTYERLPIVNGIPFQLQQLFSNLISNSIKFRDASRPLQITLSVERAPHPTVERDYMNKVSVADNGIGFETKNQERIFELFQRLHSADRYEGTGLGLAICLRVMENHGGFIKAIGRPGEGATFDLYFPRVPSDEKNA